MFNTTIYAAPNGVRTNVSKSRSRQLQCHLIVSTAAIMYCVYCFLYSAQFIVYIFTVNGIHCKLQCTVYSVHCTFVQCTYNCM